MNKSIKKIYNHKRPMPVLTSIRRGCNVMDVVWTSKRRRMLTGNRLACIRYKPSPRIYNHYFTILNFHMFPIKIVYKSIVFKFRFFFSTEYALYFFIRMIFLFSFLRWSNTCKKYSLVLNKNHLQFVFIASFLWWC